jgi:hypothetical protein
MAKGLDQVENGFGIGNGHAHTSISK